eukprot:44326-Rhodomonas_salina.1
MQEEEEGGERERGGGERGGGGGGERERERKRWRCLLRLLARDEGRTYAIMLLIWVIEHTLSCYCDGQYSTEIGSRIRPTLSCYALQ